MASETITKFAGIHSQGNHLVADAEGRLKTAEHVVINSRDVLELRKAQPKLAYDFSGTVKEILGVFQTYRILHVLHDTAGNAIYQDTGSAFTSLGSGTSYAAPDATLLRMKAAEAEQCFFVTTATGIKVVETLAAGARASGVPQGLIKTGLVTRRLINPTAGWMPKNTQVAYRAVFGRKNAYDRTLLGRPSDPYVVVNPNDYGPYTLARTLTTTVIGGTTTHTLSYPDRFQITPGESDGAGPNADFATGSALTDGGHQVNGGTGSASVTYLEAGTNGFSTGTHTFTSNNSNVAVRILLPPGLTADEHFYRLYRSKVSVSATTPPSDEMFLVQEAFITSTNITNCYIDIDDKYPEAALSGSYPLYTNAQTGEGLTQANEVPPIAKDIAAWGSRLWFANTTSRRRLTVGLIGTGSPSGVQVGDTFTVGGQAFTGVAPGAGGTNVFEVFTCYSTVSQNVAATARSLAAAINNYATISPGTGTVLASYVVPDGESMGQLLLESEVLGASSFAATSSRATCWHPQLPTSGTTISSSNDAAPNRIFYSKLNQPDSVPLLNYVNVGAKNKVIQRILPLRDKLFVFKEDGIYTVSGDYPFRVDLLDNTAPLVGADTAVPLSNEIYCHTTQGVAAVSDAGVRVVGLPVASGVVADMLGGLGTVADAFAVGNDVERQYQLWYPSGSTSGLADGAWVYSTFTKAWTKWPSLPRTCGKAVATSGGSTLTNYYGVTGSLRYSFASAYEQSGSGTVAVNYATGTTSNRNPTTRAMRITTVGSVAFGSELRLAAAGNTFWGTVASITGAGAGYYDVVVNSAYDIPDNGTSILIFPDPYSFTVTIAAFSPAVGSVVSNGVYYWTVTAVNSIGSNQYDLVVANETGITITMSGAVTVYNPINCKIEWHPFTLGAPGVTKALREVDLHFSYFYYLDNTASAWFASGGSLPESQVVGTSNEYFDRAAEGGVGEYYAYTQRLLVPSDFQVSTTHMLQLRFVYGLGSFQLNGLTLRFEPGSERNGSFD